jgi:hypothetical protein
LPISKSFLLAPTLREYFVSTRKCFDICIEDSDRANSLFKDIDNSSGSESFKIVLSLLNGFRPSVSDTFYNNLLILTTNLGCLDVLNALTASCSAHFNENSVAMCAKRAMVSLMAVQIFFANLCCELLNFSNCAIGDRHVLQCRSEQFDFSLGFNTFAHNTASLPHSIDTTTTAALYAQCCIAYCNFVGNRYAEASAADVRRLFHVARGTFTLRQTVCLNNDYSSLVYVNKNGFGQIESVFIGGNTFDGAYPTAATTLATYALHHRQNTKCYLETSTVTAALRLRRVVVVSDR